MRKYIVICFLVILCFNLCSCACKECQGDKEIDCLECNNGFIYCSNCLGLKGEVREGRCASCKGKGWLTWVNCESCDRKGYIVNPFTWEKFTCGTCDGKKAYQADCTGCEDGYTYIDCPVCNGDYSEKCTNCDYGKIACPACSQ